MNRIVTGWFRPGKKSKKLTFMSAMVCLEADCGNIWDAARMSDPCPKCGSRSVLAMANWHARDKGSLKLGRVNHGK